MQHRVVFSSGPFAFYENEAGIQVDFYDPNTSPFHVRLQIDFIHPEPRSRLVGQPRVAELTLRTAEGGAEIGATSLRAVPVTKIMATALSVLDDYMRPDEQEQKVPRHREDLMARAVDAYRLAQARGSRSPTKDAAVALGYSRTRIGALLVEARRPEHGLLGPALSGRPGELAV